LVSLCTIREGSYKIRRDSMLSSDDDVAQG
jgi:hypothetical protein